MKSKKYRVYESGDTSIEATVPVADMTEAMQLSYRNTNRLFLLQCLAYEDGSDHATLLFVPAEQAVQVLEE